MCPCGSTIMWSIACKVIYFSFVYFHRWWRHCRKVYVISKISEMNIVGSIFIYSLVATMLLPYRLLALELRRSDCWKQFRHYQKTLQKCENNLLRIDFLKNCKKAELIPKFLKFRIPNNGCFDDKAIHEFQKNCSG